MKDAETFIGSEKDVQNQEQQIDIKQHSRLYCFAKKLPKQEEKLKVHNTSQREHESSFLNRRVNLKSPQLTHTWVCKMCSPHFTHPLGER